jgi:hypothetical protein
MKSPRLSILLLALFAAGHAAAAPAVKGGNVEHGRYLVDTSGCIDCHTPMKMGPNGPEKDMTRHLSGHPEGMVMPPAPALPPGPWIATFGATGTVAAGPWGTSFAANLTSDKETGLGNWTFNDFKSTIRTGRHMGRGREILPPMPIPVYNKFNDKDLADMFAYLQSLPALKNRVPEPRPPAGQP